MKEVHMYDPEPAVEEPVAEEPVQEAAAEKSGRQYEENPAYHGDKGVPGQPFVETVE
jgi:hypothetical protein